MEQKTCIQNQKRIILEIIMLIIFLQMHIIKVI